MTLRDASEVTPRADFVDDLANAADAGRRDRAGRRSARRTPPTVPGKPSTVVPAPAAAALVIVGGTAGMAAAASGALPGESLYPIKRGVEQVAIAANLGDAAKGSALLGQAEERLEEVCALQSESASPDARGLDRRRLLRGCRLRAEQLFSVPTRPTATPEDITAVRSFTAEVDGRRSSRSADQCRPATDGSCATRPTPSPTSTSRPASSVSTCGRGAVLPARRADLRRGCGAWPTCSRGRSPRQRPTSRRSRPPATRR